MDGESAGALSCDGAVPEIRGDECLDPAAERRSVGLRRWHWGVARETMIETVVIRERLVGYPLFCRRGRNKP